MFGVGVGICDDEICNFSDDDFVASFRQQMSKAWHEGLELHILVFYNNVRDLHTFRSFAEVKHFCAIIHLASAYHVSAALHNTPHLCVQDVLSSIGKLSRTLRGVDDDFHDNDSHHGSDDSFHDGYPWEEQYDSEEVSRVCTLLVAPPSHACTIIL